MGRIRTIKPEFPHSESMGNVSRDARLLFVLMWTLADDSGRLRGASRMLASLLFPYDDDAPSLLDGWLVELEGQNCISRYEVDGSTFIQISKWSSHQKIDKPSKSRIPSFDEDSRGLAEGSRTVVGGLDQGPRTKDQKKAPAAPVVARPTAIPEQTWEAWLAIRRAKRAPLTTIAWDAVVREAAKANLSLPDAVRTMAERGWQSLKAEWLLTGRPGARPASSEPEHPRGMPVPYHDHMNDRPCLCALCVKARERKAAAS